MTVILLDIGIIGTTQPIKPAVALTGIQTDNYPSSIVVDPSTHRIYVANQVSNTVSIIGDSGKVIYRVNTSSQPASLAIDPVRGSVYVANAAANSVSVIDSLTNKIVANIQVGDYPYSLAIGGDMLFVANYYNDTVSVISLRDNKVDHTIHVGGKPSALAFDNNNGDVYVASRRTDVYVPVAI